MTLVRDFFRASFENCDGLCELRALPSKAREFVDPADAAAVERFCRERMETDNLYFGVSTRRDASSGDLGNCLHLATLFADIDKFFDAHRILSSPFSPSVIVESGTPGSYHLYYLLREPLDLTREAMRARNLLRRLALWTQGDVAAGEPARILRVPNTRNRKHTPPRPVRVVEFHPDRRYNASDCDDWLPPEPAGGPAATIDVSATIGQLRNVTLYKLGRALKGKRLPDAMIATTIRILNDQHCSPPLDGPEIDQIIFNVLSQPDRPLPTTPRIRVEVAADVL